VNDTGQGQIEGDERLKSAFLNNQNRFFSLLTTGCRVWGRKTCSSLSVSLYLPLNRDVLLTLSLYSVCQFVSPCLSPFLSLWFSLPLLSLFLFVCLCPCHSLSFSLFVCLSLSIFIYLSFSLSLCISVFLSCPVSHFFLHVSLPISLSPSLSVYLFCKSDRSLFINMSFLSSSTSLFFIIISLFFFLSFSFSMVIQFEENVLFFSFGSQIYIKIQNNDKILLNHSVYFLSFPKKSKVFLAELCISTLM
jgi:hypothetical protein